MIIPRRPAATTMIRPRGDPASADEGESAADRATSTSTRWPGRKKRRRVSPTLLPNYNLWCVAGSSAGDSGNWTWSHNF